MWRSARLTSVSSTDGFVLWNPAARRMCMMAGRRSARWRSCDCDMFAAVSNLQRYHNIMFDDAMTENPCASTACVVYWRRGHVDARIK